MVSKIDKLKEITTLAERRGFFYPTAEIYGGKAGFYTYGHLGKLMKNKFENVWRKHFLEENFWEIEGNSILPESVFKASGHLENFNDPFIECKKCHFRFRADQFVEDALGIDAEGLNVKELDSLIKKKNLKCPKCGNAQLTKVEWFNMMFPLTLGAAGSKEKAYLSPETAQNPFISFKRQFDSLRKKLPFGLAMIGKAFRNEISPRQLFFRLREFTQAELQIFFDPEDIDKHPDWKKISKYKLLLQTTKDRKGDKIKEVTCEDANKKLKLPKLYVYYMQKIQKFYLDVLKIPKKKFRLYELSKEEKAFYNKFHWDIQLDVDSLGGFKEISGLHYRSSYDLEAHQKHSKKDHTVYVEEKKKKILPHVIELSFGIDRNIFALLDLFFKKERERDLFSLPSLVSPLHVGVFPLVKKDKLPENARAIHNDLRDLGIDSFYDEDGSIGKRYRRIDEIGVPFAITVDYQTLKDKSVTIRERDSMNQKRVKISKLSENLK